MIEFSACNDLGSWKFGCWSQLLVSQKGPESKKTLANYKRRVSLLSSNNTSSSLVGHLMCT